MKDTFGNIILGITLSIWGVSIVLVVLVPFKVVEPVYIFWAEIGLLVAMILTPIIAFIIKAIINANSERKVHKIIDSIDFETFYPNQIGTHFRPYNIYDTKEQESEDTTNENK